MPSGGASLLVYFARCFFQFERLAGVFGFMKRVVTKVNAEVCDITFSCEVLSAFGF